MRRMSIRMIWRHQSKKLECQVGSTWKKSFCRLSTDKNVITLVTVCWCCLKIWFPEMQVCGIFIFDLVTSVMCNKQIKIAVFSGINAEYPSFVVYTISLVIPPVAQMKECIFLSHF
jgi:hypothetical protein